MTPGNGTAEDEVAFDYIKSTDFKVVWVDGAIGGPTAFGHIHFALYAERPAIPRRQVFKLNKETSGLGDLIPEKTISRVSHVREMSCDLMMTPDVAHNLGLWLIQQASTIKRGGAQ
jgi:Na+-translocating ferredoxin:NAD+ oxidoreductase RnfG subunit